MQVFDLYNIILCTITCIKCIGCKYVTIQLLSLNSGRLGKLGTGCFVCKDLHCTCAHVQSHAQGVLDGGAFESKYLRCELILYDLLSLAGCS